MKNYGVIVESRETDYVAGSSPVLSENRNTTKDWTPFVRPGERQSSPNLDAMDCVTQATCNSFETQVEWMLANKLLSVMWMQKAHDLGFFAVDGRFRVSRRFTARVSNTTAQGNSFQRVADSIRNIGIVAESKYPSATDGFSWQEYYKPLTADLSALAKESLKLFSALYVQVKDIKGELAHAPLVILTHVASGWFTQNPIQAEDGAVEHATQIFRADSVFYDEDSYPEFIKHLAADYPIPYVFKFVVSPIDIGNAAVSAPPFFFKRDLVYGETSEDVRQLQIRLDVPQTKVYDSLTRAAVFGFQLNHLPVSMKDMIIGLFGRRVGPYTRAILNS